MSKAESTYRKKLLILGAILGGLSVVLGAYGAHGLKPLISAENIAVFETGVRFQMYHGLLALIVGSLGFLNVKIYKSLFFLLLSGVILFSGSIYGLATNALTSFDFTKVALLTPLGGLLLISAWGVLIVSLLKIKAL